MTTINLISNPYYEFTRVLDNNNYRFTVSWNTYTSTWYMDLVGLNNDVSIKRIALLPGKDLLIQHGYYELGQLWLIDNSGANETPDYDEIGGRFSLEYTAA